MVFFFIAFLFSIFLFTFPLTFTATGYYDNHSDTIVILIRFSIFRKLIDRDQKQTDNKKSTKQKQISIDKKLPLSIIKEVPGFLSYTFQDINLYFVLPPEWGDLYVFLSTLRVINGILPVNIHLFDGERFYMEISAKMTFSIFNIIPLIKQTLKKKGEK